MQATPAIDMREKRAPISRHDRAVADARQRQQEAGNAADPDRRAELVQERDQQQRRAVIEPRGGVGGQRRRGQLDRARAPAAARRARAGRAREQQQRDQRRGARSSPCRRSRNWRPARRASDRSTVPISTAACSATVAASQSTQRDARSRPRSRAAARDARARRCRAAPPADAQQNQKQHAAQRHRLRDDGQSMDDDRQIAEQIDQQCHALRAPSR